MKVFYILLSFGITSCAVKIHSTPYSFIDDRPVNFGMDKDSILLNKINYVNISDTNRESYYLKDLKLFDSLIFRFYRGKLYGMYGFVRNPEKVAVLYTQLCNNFRSSKKGKEFYYFNKLTKNYEITLMHEQSDSLYAFWFTEKIFTMLLYFIAPIKKGSSSGKGHTVIAT